jgi:hypothetical protein
VRPAETGERRLISLCIFTPDDVIIMTANLGDQPIPLRPPRKEFHVATSLKPESCLPAIQTNLFPIWILGQAEVALLFSYRSFNLYAFLVFLKKLASCHPFKKRKEKTLENLSLQERGKHILHC